MWLQPHEFPPDSPFLLDNDAAYRRWRDAKLAAYPSDAADLVVEVNDPRAFSHAEYARLLATIRKTNLVVYASGVGADPDKAIPRRVGEQFGLTRLNHNWLADEDGLSSLKVNPAGERRLYIPYTDRPIRWHTDGYYNAPDRQIHALLLHCVHSAARGGGNALLDHEIAYILLRDQDPEIIRLLMHPQAMTIPPGTEEDGSARAACVGPVFTLHRASGTLHMRYTARKRNIQWRDDPDTRRAVAALEALCEQQLPYVYRLRLEPGMGLLCNNVLHDREGFEDLPGHPPRLLYRARYFDRIRGQILPTALG